MARRSLKYKLAAAGVALVAASVTTLSTLADAHAAATTQIGGRVWFDSNKDGKRALSEPSINGVTVRLYDGVTHALLQTTTTQSGYTYNDNTGLYRFTVPASHKYLVQVVIPAPYGCTLEHAPGTQKFNDSDINSLGLTGVINVGLPTPFDGTNPNLINNNGGLVVLPSECL